MASEIRVNTINNRSGLGTITISDTGAVFAGVTTITSLQVTGTLIGVANTDNIRTNTNATFLQNVNVSGAVTSTGMIVTGVTTVAAGSTSVPSISPSGDTNTGIFFPSSDTIAFGEGGTEAARIDSSGRLGIGTASPVQTLDVNGGIGVNGAITCKSSGTARGYLGDVDGDTHMQIRSESGQISFKKANTEFARFDTSSRFLVGTSNARTIEPYGLGTDGQIANTFESVGDTNPGPGLSLCSNSTTARMGPYLYFCRSNAGSIGSNTLVNSGDNLGTISFAGADGTDVRTRGAAIYCEVDSTPGANDMPGRLVFSTTADGAAIPTERMRINSDGVILTATTTSSGSANGVIIRTGPGTTSDASCMEVVTSAGDGRFFIGFRNNATSGRTSGAIVGSISTNGSTTSFNNSSDYRLKENITEVTDGIARLQRLKPSRFNFIIDPNTTVDGFIAHEVQEVVPEAVTGEKDAINSDGNPIYQGIDQSKLVPLLTAALQEAIGEIESLKARVAALESA